MTDRRTISVGDRVRTNLDKAWVYTGTEKAAKMSVLRTGTVERVPLETQEAGRGTMLVRWDSLDGSPNTNDRHWLMWTHSDLVEFLT